MRNPMLTAEADETYFEARLVTDRKCHHKWMSHDDLRRLAEFKSDLGEAGAITQVIFEQEGFDPIYFTIWNHVTQSHPRLQRILQRRYDDPKKLRTYLRDKIKYSYYDKYTIVQFTDHTFRHPMSLGAAIVGLLGE